MEEIKLTKREIDDATDQARKYWIDQSMSICEAWLKALTGVLARKGYKLVKTDEG